MHSNLGAVIDGQVSFLPRSAGKQRAVHTVEEARQAGEGSESVET
jgi:hypothetical protein